MTLSFSWQFKEHLTIMLWLHVLFSAIVYTQVRALCVQHIVLQMKAGDLVLWTVFPDSWASFIPYLRYSVTLMNGAEVTSSRYCVGFNFTAPVCSPQSCLHTPCLPLRGLQAVSTALDCSLGQHARVGFWLCWLLLLCCRTSGKKLMN